ncbi:nuclear factor NF-kappa-B p100 subunit-like isoform X2 [Limulus polyphemus]|uniref:Nuclear factor NF-kappa-B p100 subunit-like isoform X2 n=1 Tax=Limulus polyphemus TaxID=6850 RepID=A0ABM1TI92_LIMPO|nr:nuclear factor NF-kappa-B p100 subunit-like isoform X2 [Limulus polyphemus]
MATYAQCFFAATRPQNEETNSFYINHLEYCEPFTGRYMPSVMGEPTSLLLPEQETGELSAIVSDCIPMSNTGSSFQHSFPITTNCSPSSPLQTTTPMAQPVGVNSSPPLHQIQNGMSPSLSPEHIHTLQPACLDHPYLRILEQPTNRIRYRYKSEKGSHGGLTGKFSSSSKKTYPTVKLENYQPQNNQVFIKAALYSVDDQQKPHVHKLMGKHCQDGVCTVIVGEDMVASFQNLGILFVGKKEVPDILYKKRLEDQHLLSCLMQNGSLHITEADKNQLKKEAEQEAKNMDLNRVKIRFEAFALSQGHLYPICDAVFSNIIANQKCPDVGELKIVKMDKCSGVCTGSDEVFLLCEKVNKKDVKVIFFEEDENGMVQWQDFGSFTEADVHHQVAIVFKTPPYRDLMIKQPVKVKLQLYRYRDGECSKPKDFVYFPIDHDRDGIERKRKKLNQCQNFPGFDGEYNNFRSTQSFGSSGGSGSSGSRNASFYDHGQGSVGFQGKKMATASQKEGTQERTFGLGDDKQGKVETSRKFELSGSTDSGEVNNNQGVPSDKSLSTDELLENAFDRLCISLLKEKDKNINVSKSRNPRSENLSGKSTLASQVPPNKKTNATKAKHMELCMSTGSVSTQGDLELNSRTESTYEQNVLFSTGTAEQNGQQNKLCNLSDQWLVRKLALKMSLSLREFVCSGDLTKILVTMHRLVAIQDSNGDNLLHLAMIHHSGNQADQLVLVRCILNALKGAAKDAINQCNKLKQELLLHGANPNIADAEGNTPLHIATQIGDDFCLSILLDPKTYQAQQSPISPTLNALNYAGFAALHLAVRHDHKECVKVLCARGADINVMDGISGHTPLHLAVEWNFQNVQFLTKISHVNVNAQNFAGNTPLHLACAHGDENVVRILMDAQANPLVENYDVYSSSKKPKRDTEVSKSKGKTPLDFAGSKNQLRHILAGTVSSPKEKSQHLKSLFSVSKPSYSSSTHNDMKTSRKGSEDELKYSEGKHHLKKENLSTNKEAVSYEFTPFDSGYASGEIKTEDQNKMDHLCTKLDKNQQWKQLGMALGFENSVINSLERLCGKERSPAKAVIDRFLQENPHCDLMKMLKNALVAAELQEPLEVIQVIEV